MGSTTTITSTVRVHRPGWLKTRGFRVSDNRNPSVLRLSDFTETLENKGSHPMNAYLCLIELLGSNRHRVRATLTHVGFRRAVDQQAEQFRATVVAARIHQPLPLVDQAEIQVGDQHAFTRTQGRAEQFALRGDDRGEAAARDRPDVATGVLHYPGLLIGVQPGGGADDEAAGFQGVLADVDLDQLGEGLAPERAGIHRRVDLLAVGHQGVTGERVVMLPARERADAPDRAVDGAQARAVALPPDQALVVGRGDLAAMLEQT